MHQAVAGAEESVPHLQKHRAEDLKQDDPREIARSFTGFILLCLLVGKFCHSFAIGIGKRKKDGPCKLLLQ
jgi:hypothetical protein